jgi:hypothetical protein
VSFTVGPEQTDDLVAFGQDLMTARARLLGDRRRT